MHHRIYDYPVFNETGNAYKFPENLYRHGDDVTAEIHNEQFFSELFRKQPPIGDKALDDVTIDLFLKTERKTAAYNAAFPTLLKDRTFRSIIRLLRIEMLYILGPSPVLDVPSAMTSGATTTCRSGNTPVHRWLDPEITDDLFAFVQDHYISAGYVFPCGALARNNYATASQVSKTIKINRLVFLPPVCNVTFERMLGLQIGNRASLRGIHIPTAADKHKLLAYYGSFGGFLNTDDLENASNSIASSLIEATLPPLWFDALDAARCKSIVYNRADTVHHHHLAMFMGNGCGFCFELETVLFAAMIKVAYKMGNIPTRDDYRDIHVYGDDMIYLTEATASVRAIIRACGLTTHLGKSFSDGFFRESCGGDYISGQYVRPIHLKSHLETDRERVIFLNQITKKRRLNPAFYTPEIHLVYCSVLSSFDKQSNIFFGPEHMGDSVLQCPPFVDLPIPTANRFGVARMKIWTSTPENVECFETFSRRLPEEAILTLGANAHLRDLGARTLCLITGADLRGQKGYNKNGYPMVARPGTRYLDTVSKTLFFPTPNRVDEQDPITSVFSLLCLTRRASFPLTNYVVFNERRARCAAYAYTCSRMLSISKSHQETLDMTHVLDQLTIFNGG